MIKKKVTIYTDGACSGNPGPGGWSAILIYENKTKEISGGERSTTNNAMEMTAVISALKILKESCDVDLYTDSKYVIDGITKWIHSWKNNNWKTADKKPVKNLILWQDLSNLSITHNINWTWVKGHADNHLNNRADELARLACQNTLRVKD